MEILRKIAIEALVELSDETLQRQRWLSTGEGEVSSFTEAVCGLYDDSGLGRKLERGQSFFGREVDASLRRFSETLRDVERLRGQLGPEAFIEHPDMGAVRAFALAILSQIKTSN